MQQRRYIELQKCLHQTPRSAAQAKGPNHSAFVAKLTERIFVPRLFFKSFVKSVLLKNEDCCRKRSCRGFLLIQAEDKRLSPHEETGAAQRKNRFIQGYKCHVGGRRKKRGGRRESKRCVDKERKWREQTDGPGIFNKLNEVIIS